MDITDCFRFPLHNSALRLIHGHLNLELIESCNLYFGGGTLCSMRYGEYRESVDIDFLCSDHEKMRNLNINYEKISDLPKARDSDFMRDSVRLWLKFEEQIFKVEFVKEYRIPLQAERFQGILSLTPTSLLACKLMANVDRGAPSSYQHLKDMVDITAVYMDSPNLLKPAWDIAHGYYKEWLDTRTAQTLNTTEFKSALDKFGIDGEQKYRFENSFLDLKQEIENRRKGG